MQHTTRLYPSLLIAAAMSLLLLTVARADESETTTIKFSDPAKPGFLRVNVASGDVTIHGADTTDVTVQTDLKPEAPAQRKDGLRVLTSAASYSLTENHNVVTLSYGTESWGGGENSGSFEISVPHGTAVIVTCSYAGDVRIEDITGSIDVKGLNGEVTLNNISGAALFETINGEIHADVRELVDGKPLSFTSMNGEVTLHLPAAAKANVSLRSHNGSILTDFDDKALVTKTESVHSPFHIRSRVGKRVNTNGEDATEAQVEAAVHEAVIAGAQAAHEAANAIKEAAHAAREAARESEREARAESDSESPTAPLPPLAPLPPMTGGKIVTGALNGGGPEIRITTMNGDITLRKTVAK